MENSRFIIEKGSVIAATRSDEEFLHALSGESPVVFDLSPDIMNISAKIKRAAEKGKKYLVHIDLAKGIGKDESGIRFLARLGVDGIISTKVSMIKLAREYGLFTVQRFFIVDSQSVETTAEAVKASRPDMAEIMPGTLCKVMGRVAQTTSVPVIAGGLVETDKEVRDALSAGAYAVSTGKESLWGLKNV